jgi:hypothetical protein
VGILNVEAGMFVCKAEYQVTRDLVCLEVRDGKGELTHYEVNSNMYLLIG